jgi:hypothetical protein
VLAQSCLQLCDINLVNCSSRADALCGSDSCGAE